MITIKELDGLIEFYRELVAKHRERIDEKTKSINLLNNNLENEYARYRKHKDHLEALEIEREEKLNIDTLINNRVKERDRYNIPYTHVFDGEEFKVHFRTTEDMARELLKGIHGEYEPYQRLSLELGRYQFKQVKARAKEKSETRGEV